MKNYRDFESVEELLEYYQIKPLNTILEKQTEEDAEKLVNSEKDMDDPEKVAKPEKFEVVYADLKATPTNIFKHIIVFTNDRDPKNNKTLKNIYDAVKTLKEAKCEIIPEVHVFVAAEIDADEREYEIKISDGDEEFIIKDESNVDTLIFSRLGVQDEDQCEHIVQLLQDRGFLVLNPVKYSALACDKYQSAVLMERYGIPQPRYALLSIDDVSEGMDSLSKKLEAIYPDLKSMSKEKQQKCEYVIKLLSGHGGCGVFLCDGSSILGIFLNIVNNTLSNSLESILFLTAYSIIKGITSLFGYIGLINLLS